VPVPCNAKVTSFVPHPARHCIISNLVSSFVTRHLKFVTLRDVIKLVEQTDKKQLCNYAARFARMAAPCYVARGEVSCALHHQFAH